MRSENKTTNFIFLSSQVRAHVDYCIILSISALTFIGRVVGVRRAKSFGSELHHLHFVSQHVSARGFPYVLLLNLDTPAYVDTKIDDNAIANQ